MENQMNEDSLYIKQFLSGETEGFEMLVRKYQDRVLNIVYSLIRQDMESEDIMQEVFLKAYHNLRFFRQESQFFTWLYRIVVNTTYDFLRKRRGFVRNEVIPGVNTVADGPRDTLLAKEKEIMIREALLSVPFKFRAALVLKDIEGLSYAEISRILCCGIGTVESRIYRARQFLKKRLIRLGEDIT
jgi:RNA polymerase sigma-70 factor (ECF subfamily)